MTETMCKITDHGTQCIALRLMQELAEIRVDLDEAIREARPRINSDSQPWQRNLLASIRGIQSRIERL
jgi:hypothetical protein